MYSKTARYYDQISSFKDYRAECERLLVLIRENLRSTGNNLLDVACFAAAGLEDSYDEKGLMGRGLYLGRRA